MPTKKKLDGRQVKGQKAEEIPEPEDAPVDTLPNDTPPVAADAAPEPGGESSPSTPSLKDVTQGLGIKPEDMAAFLQPLITQGVLETLNQINIGKRISEAATEAVKSQLEPLITQANKLMPGGGTGGGVEMTTGDAGAEAALKPGGGGGMGEQLLLTIFQKFLNGGNGNGNNPLDSMQKIMETMTTMRNWASAMYQTPRNEVYSEVANLLKMGYQSGLKPDQLANSLESSIKKSAQVTSETK